jgi:hypothetical protein
MRTHLSLQKDVQHRRPVEHPGQTVARNILERTSPSVLSDIVFERDRGQIMREIRSGVIISIAIGALAVSASVAFSETTDPIEWAFPGTARPSTSPPSRSEERRVLLPGSNLRFNEAQLHDDFSAVDWWPDSHPASPLIVRQGHQPATMACGFCHLPAGQGRPENAALAGLPSATSKP